MEIFKNAKVKKIQAISKMLRFLLGFFSVA